MPVCVCVGVCNSVSYGMKDCKNGTNVRTILIMHGYMFTNIN